MVFYYGWINEVPSVQVPSTTVDWVTPGSPAAMAGFQPGDVITHFDDAENPDWEKIHERAKLNADQTVPVTVDRGGSALNLTLNVPASAKNDDFDVSDAGLQPQYLPGPSACRKLHPGTPAEQAGLHAGDAIEAVDGHAFHSVDTLVAYMQAGQGKPIDLTVLRNGANVQMVAHPAKLDASGYKLGFVSVIPPYRENPLPLGEARSTKADQFLRRQLLPHRRSAAADLYPQDRRLATCRARWALPAWPAMPRR